MAACFVARLAEADPPRYVGELLDGTKISGVELKGLQESPAAWKLDATPLFGDNPLRWLKDRSLAVSAPPLSCIEFRNGDLLPGEVSQYNVGSTTGDSTAEPCLVFSTFAGPDIAEIRGRFEGKKRAPGISFRTVRMDVSQVRRIVWRAGTNNVFTPKTIFFRDGRSTTYRSLRWEESAVKILGEQGPATVGFEEIAELHLEASDPWSDYVRQLAILMPELHGRIVQYETEDGARVTASTDRYQLPTYYPNPTGDKKGGRGVRFNLQVAQPTWSLDPVWLDMAKIRARRYFGPHEVPLSALTPSAVQQSTGLARSWRPQVDRNVQGGPLINGGAEYGWGWGVHAFNRMEFDLPPFARTFQTKIGLDQVAGKGGCAKGLVSCNSGGERTLFASPVLIGSKDAANSGQLDLPDVGNKDRKLVLLADPLLKEHPPGTDPLEIGDVLDWLEPLVTLDPQRLREEVVQRVKEEKAKRFVRTDREPLREVLAQLAPGFEPGQPDVGFKMQRTPDGSPAVELMPNPRFLPQILWRLIEVPANKITKLRITSTRTNLPWTMVVVANGITLANQPFDVPENQWQPREIDLTRFAGRRIALEIDDVDPLPTSGIARIKQIEIVSTDPPKPPEEKKPEEGK